MRLIYILFFLLFSASFVRAQDIREFNHGSCIVEFMQNDSIKYYLTWSSAYQQSWEHDIYNSVIYINKNGNLITQSPDTRYIGNGNDEAQEPVNATYDTFNGNILTVWEDGTGNNAPDVRGQLHKPDGTIIKNNWIIAGGTGSQHSANTAHLSNVFLIFYADEAPPSIGGAVVKCKVIDDLSGTETQSINLTQNNEDHWWPVSVSNKANTRTLVIWGNDGYAVRGSVLFNDNETIVLAQTPQDYLTNTQQYYYQAIWLENISKFLITARDGAYDNITGNSQICIVDTLGNMVSAKTIVGGIIREAKPAAIWSNCTQSYHVFYPAGVNELVHFEISSDSEINSSSQILTSPDLNNIHWVPTGTWSSVVKDINNNETWQDNHIIFFTFNDTSSNDIIKSIVHINNDILCQNLSVISEENKFKGIRIFPNPTSNLFFINNISFNNQQISIKIYNSIGQLILTESKTFTNNRISINMKNLPTGIYFVELKSNPKGQKEIIKLIKK